MKKIFALLFLVYSVHSSAQEAFTVHVVPSTITAVPAVHSGAFASYSGKWIFIGGRIDGMHLMQAGQAFPVYGRNDSIFVVDPAGNSYRSVTASTLPGFLYEALCSSNMQYYQEGQYLYMIGGYGSEDSSGNWITFPSLISVDLDCLVNNISSGTAISGCFRQLVDTNMAVTGGEMEKLILPITLYSVTALMAAIRILLRQCFLPSNTHTKSGSLPFMITV